MLDETRSRVAQLRGQWQALQDGWFSKEPERYSPGEGTHMGAVTWGMGVVQPG